MKRAVIFLLVLGLFGCARDKMKVETISEPYPQCQLPELDSEDVECPELPD